MPSEKNHKRKIQLAKEAAAKAAGLPEVAKLNPAEQRAKQAEARRQLDIAADSAMRAAKLARSAEILARAAKLESPTHTEAPKAEEAPAEAPAPSVAGPTEAPAAAPTSEEKHEVDEAVAHDEPEKQSN